MKIKLKDMTKEQYYEWKDKKCMVETTCKVCPFRKVICAKTGYCWVHCKDQYSDKFLNQEIEIEDEPILDAQEKKYLENLLRPFKNRRIKIVKVVGLMAGEAFINIKIEREVISFPYFAINEMYKGMEPGKEYTLKELGLFQDE